MVPEATRIGKAGTVLLSVVIREDGSPGTIRIPEGVPAPLAGALRTAARACAFTPARDGGGAPYASALRLPVRLEPSPPRAGGTGMAPAYEPDDAPLPLAQQGAPAREREPGCVARRLVWPPDRMLRGTLTFQVPVAADGTAGALALPASLPEDVAAAVRQAVAWCDFVPATGGDGTLQAGEVPIQLQFTAPGDQERRALAGQLSREARIASRACLERIPNAGIRGHLVVALRISEEGRPSEMRLKPDNVSADRRMAIFDALALCSWEPALDREGKPVASTTSVTVHYR